VTSYAILLCLALALNIRNRPMLALSLVVGAGIFFPVPDALFYLVCMLLELLVGLLAYRIACPASKVIVRLSALLFAFHSIGWIFNGHPVGSPYHLLVKATEHAELLACVLMSKTITNRLHNAST
jgi:hypothetical protein